MALARKVISDTDLAKQVLWRVRQRLQSHDEAYGLKRDLDVPHEAPRALIEFDIRPIRAKDVPLILGTEGRVAADEKWDQASRRRLVDSHAGTCYVAITPDGQPCYMQWLFSHRDNDFLQHYFKGSFPTLDAETALLEGAFTPSAFRGQRIMSAAMSQIAERARDHGARYVITFVGVDNAASLKGCERSGFRVYARRLQDWHALRRSVDFRYLDDAADHVGAGARIAAP
jgi:ribosomal protein S18 acetylase RimI-like enzyme